MVEFETVACPDPEGSFAVLSAHVDETGCVACAEIAARKINAGLVRPSDSPSDEQPVDVRPSGLAAWRAQDEARLDREKEARGLKPFVNQGAYSDDAVVLGDAEIEPPAKPREAKDAYLGASVESLMDPGVTPTGSSSNGGRRRTDVAQATCGEPCDRGCGMPCEIRLKHEGSHACRECKHAARRGRRTIESEPRQVRLNVRISYRTQYALEHTGKSMSTIVAELAAAILEGRPYNPHNPLA